MRGAAENAVLGDVDGADVGKGAGGEAARQQRGERRRERGPFEVELHLLEELRAVEAVDVEGVEEGARLGHLERRHGDEDDRFVEPLGGGDEPVLRSIAAPKGTEMNLLATVNLARRLWYTQSEEAVKRRSELPDGETACPSRIS